jgi:hypothetical protein
MWCLLSRLCRGLEKGLGLGAGWFHLENQEGCYHSDQSELVPSQSLGVFDDSFQSCIRVGQVWPVLSASGATAGAVSGVAGSIGWMVCAPARRGAFGKVS